MDLTIDLHSGGHRIKAGQRLTVTAHAWRDPGFLARVLFADPDIWRVHKIVIGGETRVDRPAGCEPWAAIEERLLVKKAEAMNVEISYIGPDPFGMVFEGVIRCESAPLPGGPFEIRHHHLIREAAASLVAVADDAGVSLVDVIAEMERYIVKETKVGDAADPLDQAHADLARHKGRIGYTLEDGRLVEHGRS